MSKIGWALVAVLVTVQLAFAMELLELASLVKRVQGIEIKTAMMKNEAAALALESERMRNNYYRIYSISPFVLTEEEARGIIQSGARNPPGEK